MTSSTTLRFPARRRPRRAVRPDRLVAAVLVAVVAGCAATSVAVAPSSGGSAAAPPRVALIVDAGASPDAALARARAAAAEAERTSVADVAVRVPRTAAEAAADVRYFVAQHAVARVVAVGPVAAAAARDAAADYPDAALVLRGAVPRTLR
jgi:hypothetical protein